MGETSSLKNNTSNMVLKTHVNFLREKVEIF